MLGFPGSRHVEQRVLYTDALLKILGSFSLPGQVQFQFHFSSIQVQVLVLDPVPVYCSPVQPIPVPFIGSVQPRSKPSPVQSRTIVYVQVNVVHSIPFQFSSSCRLVQLSSNVRQAYFQFFFRAKGYLHFL